MYFGTDRFYDGLFPEYQKDLNDWIYSEMYAFLKGLSNTRPKPKQTEYNDTLCEIQSTDRKYEFIAKAKDVELIEQ